MMMERLEGRMQFSMTSAGTENCCNSKVIEENNKNGKRRDLYQEIQEIKGKFKPGLGELNDQQGSTVSDQEQIKGRWKQNTENLHGRDERTTGALKKTPPLRKNRSF